jgi:hypothetical protein
VPFPTPSTGLCTLGYAVRALLLRVCDGDAERVAAVRVRFSGVVRGGGAAAGRGARPCACCALTLLCPCLFARPHPTPFRVRTSLQVFPGETLETSMWVTSPTRIEFTARTTDRGAPALAAGTVELRDAARL